MEQKYITDKQGNKVLPITHVNAVRDDNGNTISSLFGAYKDNVNDRLDTQDAEIELLNGSEVIVVADHTAVTSPDSQKIYREQGTTSYIDWMYQNSEWKEIATYSFPGTDDVPTAGSGNLVKSSGVYETTKLGTSFNPHTFVNQNGVVNTTTATLFKTTNYIPTFEGITIHAFQRYTTGGYNVKLCFYDANKNFLSYMSGEDNGDVTLTNENIPANAKFFIANLNATNGAIYSKYRIDYMPFIDGLYNEVHRIESSVFYLIHLVTNKTGYISYTPSDYRTSPYISVNDIEDYAKVKCVFSSSVGIQCFDVEKNFIGVYNDFASVSLSLITFNFDKSKLPQNTVFIRMCGNNDCYISGLSWKEEYDMTDNGYLIASSQYYKDFVKNFVKIKFDENYFDYDKVVARLTPSDSEIMDIANNGNKYFAFQFYQNNAIVKTKYVYLRDCIVKGHVLYFYDGKTELEYVFSQRRTNGGSLEGGFAVCTIKAFSQAIYKDLLGDYVITETPSLETRAAGFTYVKYTAQEVLDITCQRFPATDDALAQDSQEYFAFYIWDNGVKVKTLYCYISDATVENNVITYVSDLISFTVNYSIVGNVSRVVSTSRIDLVFAQKCFDLEDTTDKHIRTDIINKKYANISSSTFSSYMWHQNCVEDLGMEYTNFGMGGASHRPYSGARFNLNYQDPTQPVADRNILNMVAKICTENANNGYYPDIIASCCVLNDCNTWATMSMIGTAEEAIAATLPSLDITDAASIASTFSAFFESTDPDVVAFRGKSCNMMRLAFELLSQKFPYAQIIICSCQQIANTSFDQSLITKFNEEQKKIAKYLALPYIDINGETGINNATIDTFLKSDKLHPNPAGELVYKKFMRERLNCMITLKR